MRAKNTCGIASMTIWVTVFSLETFLILAISLWRYVCVSNTYVHVYNTYIEITHCARMWFFSQSDEETLSSLSSFRSSSNCTWPPSWTTLRPLEHFRAPQSFGSAFTASSRMMKAIGCRDGWMPSSVRTPIPSGTFEPWRWWTEWWGQSASWRCTSSARTPWWNWHTVQSVLVTLPGPATPCASTPCEAAC